MAGKINLFRLRVSERFYFYRFAGSDDPLAAYGQCFDVWLARIAREYFAVEQDQIWSRFLAACKPAKIEKHQSQR